MINRIMAMAGICCLLFAMSNCKGPDSEGEKRQRKDIQSKSEMVLRSLKILPDLLRNRSAADREIENLPEPVHAEIPDADTMFGWVEKLCVNPHRRPGTEYGHLAENWVEERFKQIGLEEVRKDPIDIIVWDAHNWQLRIEENGDWSEFPSFYVPRTGFTGPEGVTGEMVYVGLGQPEDFEGVSVKGKIAVADVVFPEILSGLMVKLGRGGYYASDPENSLGWGKKHVLIFIRQNFPRQAGDEHSPNSAYWNAYERGAVGMIAILSNHPGNTNSHYGPYDRVMKPMPAMWVGKHDGERLREMARRGARSTIIIEGIKGPGVTHNVWGMLPGMSDEIIMISSHHDSPFQGAIEDATGISMVLAQAWAWSKAPKEKRPRTLLFIADAGHFYGAVGAEQMCLQHPDLMEKVLVDFNLEHLAAREVDEKDKDFSLTGQPETTMMFITPNPHLIAAVKRSLQRNQPKRFLAVPFNLLGPIPAGDGGRYHQHNGMQVINTISMPYYLLTAEDTLDKVDKSQLEIAARTATDIVGTLMNMDRDKFIQ